MVRRIRDYTAVLLLGVCLAVSLKRYFQVNDPLVDFFAALSNNLSAQRSAVAAIPELHAPGAEIGYVSGGDPGTDGDTFFALQYVLLPAVLVRSTLPATVLYWGSDPSRLAKILEQSRLTVVSRGGAGLVVLRHQNP